MSRFAAFQSASVKPTVFEDIDLDVDEGKICVLVGPSGCGKTTLLRAVAGLATSDKGAISIDGRDVTAVEAKHRGVGMVFQHYALFPNMTVEQNLAFGLQQKKLPKADIAERVAAIIKVMGLEPRAKARPAELSGGQTAAGGAGPRPGAAAQTAAA